MSESIISFEKYKKDITAVRVMNYYADCKIKRIESYIHQALELIAPLVNQAISSDSAIWRAKEKLEECLNVERPDLISLEDSKKRIKYTSVADGVQACFEFEGER